MNDRMTELYAGACLYAREQHPTEVPAFIACMAERFAELIVQECLDVCKSETMVRYAAEVCASRIKEHFGVEE